MGATAVKIMAATLLQVSSNKGCPVCIHLCDCFLLLLSKFCKLLLCAVLVLQVFLHEVLLYVCIESIASVYANVAMCNCQINMQLACCFPPPMFLDTGHCFFAVILHEAALEITTTSHLVEISAGCV